MLTIKLPGVESFDSEKQEFVYGPETFLDFEHSLASISKWESTWEVPFLTKDEKTQEQLFSYLEFMCLTPGVPPETFRSLPKEAYNEINAYIGKKMTATWFTEKEGPASSRDIVTSEIVYYWMFNLNIPIECENWHFTKLTTLIKVTSLKNQPKKKMSQREVMAQHRELLAQRRKEASESQN